MAAVKSRYTLFIDNLSSATRSGDVRKEAERAGKVLEVIRDPKHKSDDAAWAWEKLDGVKMDGRNWRVDWATPTDFDKRWTESASASKRARSRSRTPSRDSREFDQNYY
ncbi:hypothetical protein Rsub_07120 [Raphidocelis subcapitata]|uniref:RRM domain-containing protein n=1 Tax=Raphidocelis subcapitata TaxID=307507 RepID=A0A2V0P8C4_9CHLO|nr:hypothetical protein Rsub_07120 [Raphidocelis subcapitata]|eukprot:GBF94133.1 hypothetical protein Rsub_07120 [Raphidocelis subcapitata]